MNKTRWKPTDEIKYSLRNTKKVSILSCGLCANLSNTGGTIGIKVLKELLAQWDKEVVFSRCIIACCPQDIMEQALDIYRKSISKSDALVILSCAAGIKSAYLCRPQIPIISALDPIGSVAISGEENPIARSACNACGQCVITYTGGICPISECPSKHKYGPCKQYPENGTQCAVDESRDCIWKIIAEKGDLVALEKIGRLHKERDNERPVTPEIKHAPPLVKKAFGWFSARSRGLENIIRILQ